MRRLLDVATNPDVTQTTAIINRYTHFFSTRCLNGQNVACTRSKAILAMFINEPKTNKSVSAIMKLLIPTPVGYRFHRLQFTPGQKNRLYTATNPTNMSITAKFITRYVLRLRRLRFLIKTIIVQMFNVTIATDSARPTIIQGMHTEKDDISKLCPVRRICNYLSACGKKCRMFFFFRLNAACKKCN